jgi:hypothetical protein
MNFFYFCPYLLICCGYKSVLEDPHVMSLYSYEFRENRLHESYSLLKDVDDTSYSLHFSSELYKIRHGICLLGCSFREIRHSEACFIQVRELISACNFHIHCPT